MDFRLVACGPREQSTVVYSSVTCRNSSGTALLYARGHLAILHFAQHLSMGLILVPKDFLKEEVAPI